MSIMSKNMKNNFKTTSLDPNTIENGNGNENDSENDNDNEIQILLNEFDSSNYNFIRQVDQQFQIEHGIQNITKGIQTLDAKRKQKIKNIKSCERRIIKLQKQITSDSSNQYNTDRYIDDEINKTILEGSGCTFKTCRYCGRKIIADLIIDHQDQCKSIQSVHPIPFAYNSKQKKVSSLRTKPQKPRNFHVKYTGHNSITLGWSPPILDGGHKIYEYQIYYQISQSIREGKLITKRTLEPNIIVNCSRWCLRDPVPNNGYKLCFLNANTEYINLQVRCRNSIGWGPFSKTISTVKTKRKVINLICCSSKYFYTTFNVNICYLISYFISSNGSYVTAFFHVQSYKLTRYFIFMETSY